MAKQQTTLQRDAEFTLTRVHVYEGDRPGHEQLVLTQLIKTFEWGGEERELYFKTQGRQGSKTGDLHRYYTQNGRWFLHGGKEINMSEVPEWVWKDCRAMSAEERSNYFINLPEEISEGGMWMPEDAERAAGDPNFPSDHFIRTAVTSLDHEDDSFWTETGWPRVERLFKLSGVRISANRIKSCFRTPPRNKRGTAKKTAAAA